MNLSGLSGLSAGPAGYAAQTSEMAEGDYKRAQATELQDSLLGRKLLGNAFQMMFSGADPGQLAGLGGPGGFTPPPPQAPMPGQMSVAAQPPMPPSGPEAPLPPGGGPGSYGPARGDIVPQQAGAQPLPNIQEGWAAFPGAAGAAGGSNPPVTTLPVAGQAPAPGAPSVAAGPPVGAPPPIPAGGPGGPSPGGPPGGPGPQPAGGMPAPQSMDWRQLGRMIVEANPGAPPQAIAAALNHAIPLMTMSAQAEWRQISAALKDKSIEQRDVASQRSYELGNRREDEKNFRQRNDLDARLERLKISTGVRMAVAELQGDVRLEAIDRLEKGRDNRAEASNELKRWAATQTDETKRALGFARIESQERQTTERIEGGLKREGIRQEGATQRTELLVEGRRVAAGIRADQMRDLEVSRREGNREKFQAALDKLQLTADQKAALTAFVQDRIDARQEKGEAGKTARTELIVEGRRVAAGIRADQMRDLEVSRREGNREKFEAALDRLQLSARERAALTEHIQDRIDTRQEKGEAGRTVRHEQSESRKTSEGEARSDRFQQDQARKVTKQEQDLTEKGLSREGRERVAAQRAADTQARFEKREERQREQFSKVQDAQGEKLQQRRHEFEQRYTQSAASLDLRERVAQFNATMNIVRAHDSYMRNRIQAMFQPNDKRGKELLAKLDAEFNDSKAVLEAAKNRVERPSATSAPAPAPAATLPPEAARQLKEGHDTRFGNGQVWTLRGGQPVQVK